MKSNETPVGLSFYCKHGNAQWKHWGISATKPSRKYNSFGEVVASQIQHLFKVASKVLSYFVSIQHIVFLQERFSGRIKTEISGKPLCAQYILNVCVPHLVGKRKKMDSSWDFVSPFGHVKECTECLFQVLQIKECDKNVLKLSAKFCSIPLSGGTENSLFKKINKNPTF